MVPSAVDVVVVGGGGVVVGAEVSACPVIVVSPNAAVLGLAGLGWCRLCTSTAAMATTISTVATTGVTVNSRPLRRP